MKQYTLKLLQAKSGFGIVETLIALGIFAILTVAIVSSQVQMFQTVRSINQSQDIESLVSGIDLALNNSTSCKTLFTPQTFSSWGGSGGNTISLSTLVYNGTKYADTTALIGNVGTQYIQLSDLNVGGKPFQVMVNTALSPAPPKYVPAYQYLVEMDVNYYRPTPEGGATKISGIALHPKKFFLTVDILASNKSLFSCYGGVNQDFFQELCERQMGGTYDPSRQPSCLIPNLAVAPDWNARDAALKTLTGGNNYGVAVNSPAQSVLYLYGPGDGDTFSGIYFGNQTMLTGGGNWVIDYKTPADTDASAFRMTYQSSIGKDQDQYLVLEPTTKTVVVAQQMKALGNVNLGQNLTVSQNVTVSGSITASGTITASSDRRLKKDIHPLNSVLDRIQGLEPVRYYWKDQSKLDSREHFGLIAQDLEKIFPELVRTDENGMKSVAYLELSAVLLKAVLELSASEKAKAMTYEKENQDLKNALAHVEGQITKLTKELSGLRKVSEKP